ncbi:MAG: hypothetical protein F4X83_02340 [Chloroflexi bacterium]|nr:hypothetical protein [Chloroflexota bacterium]
MARELEQRGDRVQRLQEARDALAALLANSIATDLRERERGGDASADDDDFVDLAQEVAIQEDREAVLDVLRRDMRAFDQAWQKAEAGTYGVCEDCGEGISAERLEFMPEATLCVPCQARRERAWLGAR